MASRHFLPLLLLCTYIALAIADEEVTPENSDILFLDEPSFDDEVGGDKGVLVKFYAPWCGHCKRLAPDWEKLATSFKRTSNVGIAKVDCDSEKNKALCSKFGVSGYPTLKWFSAGETKGEDYKGGRDLDALISFVNEKAGTNVKVATPPSDVIALDPSNFDKVLLDSSADVFAEFYAPWCGHCKSLVPTYEKFATAFKNEKGVKIVKIDADAHKDLAERFGVSGFPTLKWFPKNDKSGIDYSGGRDLKSLVDFVNEQAGTARSTTGGLNSKAGRVSALDSIASGFLAAKADERDELVKNAEAEVEKISDEVSQKHAQQYIKVFKNILSKGDQYAEKEDGRLSRMLSGSLKAEKVDELTIKRNIVSAFLTQSATEEVTESDAEDEE